MRATITTNTGVEIHYKDMGSGRPIVFSHAWPLSSDEWDAQILFFLQHGYRVIVFDRRGHGRSSLTTDGHDMGHFAGDLAALTKKLDLKDAVHVGHSMGGGEIVRYAARCGQGRVSKLVLIGSVTPGLVKSDANPTGMSRDVFDQFRARLAHSRARFFYELAAGPYYGFNREGTKCAPGMVENWVRQGLSGGIKAQYDSVCAFSETDFREDLKAIDLPVLILHGEDDQIVPVECSRLTANLLSSATLKVYPGLPHGMPATHPDEINADILAFIQS